jgi:RNase P subunit RPR2
LWYDEVSKGDFMKCYICGDNAISLHGKKNVCTKHKRFLQMQHTAKTDKKYVPSIYELEKLTPKDMACQDCGSIMHWIDNDNRRLGAVLQHYRNGTLGITCMSCNTKHGLMVGDSYRDVPVGHKFCRACKTIKPLSMFNVRRDNKVEYPMSKCKPCNLHAHREWRLKNPEKYKASNKKHNDLRKVGGGKDGLSTV